VSFIDCFKLLFAFISFRNCGSVSIEGLWWCVICYASILVYYLHDSCVAPLRCHSNETAEINGFYSSFRS